MQEVKVILTGACGRMGKAVTAAAKEHPEIKLIAGVDLTQEPAGFPIYGGIAEVPEGLQADVIIDFSHHTATAGLLRYAEKAKCGIIICTTGHTEEELKLIEEAGKKLPVFRSGNMSLGVNLLLSLVEKASAVLKDFDIEIVEMHHNKKKDAPSGTALMLADAAQKGRDGGLTPVFDRHEVRGERGANEIGIHSVRGGTIVGEHEVIFAGKEEVVTLSHSASSREIFAQGAIQAAVFLKGKPCGYYTMKDVIAEMTD